MRFPCVVKKEPLGAPSNNVRTGDELGRPVNGLPD